MKAKYYTTFKHWFIGRHLVDNQCGKAFKIVTSFAAILIYFPQEHYILVDNRILLRILFCFLINMYDDIVTIKSIH